MSVASAPLPHSPFVLPADWTVADLQAHLGDIPLQRIRIVPPPGFATERDLVALDQRRGPICELIDGTLVEKTVGHLESLIAVVVATIIRNYLDGHDLGTVAGADGTIRLLPNQIRVPDVAFYSWSRYPSGKVSSEPIPSLVPDLAVEVLSKSNTPAEMRRKLDEYFQAGAQLVWLIDPAKREGRAYRNAKECDTIPADGVFDAGSVLPGFTLSLAEVFRKAGV